MAQETITLTIEKQKNIALIAHDNKKEELIQWCDKNQDILKKHFLWDRNHSAADHGENLSAGEGI